MAKGTIKAADCLAIIRKASGNKAMTEKEAQILLDSVEEHIRATKNRLTPNSWTEKSLQDDVVKFITKKTEETKLAALIRKHQDLINIRSEKSLKDYIDRSWKLNPAMGINAYAVGTVRPFQGGRLSTDTKGKARAQKFLGYMLNDLYKAKVFPEFVRGKLGREIAIELYELAPGGRPGLSKSKAAEKIAKVVTKYQHLAVSLANRNGAFILFRPGYIGRIGHDQTKLRKFRFPKGSGSKQWVDDIMPLLDHELTFKDHPNPREMLDDIFHALTTGQHYKLDAISEEGILGFTGTANIAKKLSKAKILHFKDGAAWYEYNQKYGTGPIHETIVFGLEHMARAVTLLEDWGTNPRAMMDRMIDFYKSDRTLNDKAIKDLGSIRLQNVMSELDGTTRIPVSLSGARLGSFVRAIQTLSKLGMATISSITDIPIQVHGALRQTGIDPFTGYLNAFRNLVRGRGDKYTREVAMLLGSGFDGLIGDVVTRITANDGIYQVGSRLQRKYFKYNVMSWWNDAHKTGIVSIISTHLASNSNKPLSKLSKELQSTMNLYDISARDWDIIRATDYDPGNGNRYLTGDKIDQLDSEIFRAGLVEGGVEKPTKNQLDKARDKLALKFQTLFQDMADTGIPIPGASEHAMLNQGLRPGTIPGETIRLFGQFKSFPTTLLHKVVGPAMLRNVDDPNVGPIKALVTGQSDVLNLVQLMVSLTGFGYAAITLKDLARGITPPPPTLRNIQRAMAQGGGLGIYGDFIFGEFSSFGKSATTQLLGPSLGQFDTVMELYTRFKQNEKPAKSIVRLLVSNMPGSNLFYTKFALDYLFLTNLYEGINPGYIGRIQKRLEKDRNQRFIIPPRR